MSTISQVSQFDFITQLPNSSQKILRVLQLTSPITQKELVFRVKLPSKTVRYGLKKLEQAQLVSLIPNLEDMRSHFIQLNMQLTSEEMALLEAGSSN